MESGVPACLIKEIEAALVRGLDKILTETADRQHPPAVEPVRGLDRLAHDRRRPLPTLALAMQRMPVMKAVSLDGRDLDAAPAVTIDLQVATVLDFNREPMSPGEGQPTGEGIAARSGRQGAARGRW